MKSQAVADQRTPAVPFEIFRFLLFHGRGEAVQAAGQHTAHPRIHAGLSRRVRHQVHVKDRGDAGGKVFQHGKSAKMVNIVPGKLRLHGKHLFFQPYLQFHIIRKRTQKRHGRMGMGIFKARHQQIVPAVHFDIPVDFRIILARFQGRSP